MRIAALVLAVGGLSASASAADTISLQFTTLAGREVYVNAGSLTSGDIAVTWDADGRPRSVTGEGILVGTRGGTARVAFDLRRVLVLPCLYGGTIRVSDAGAAFEATIAVTEIQETGASTLSGIALGQANRRPVQLRWSLMDAPVVPAAPPAPTITSTDPASPSPSTTPRVIGVAPQADSVQVFTSAGCAGAPAASGTAASFAAGLTVSVPSGATTNLTARSSNAGGFSPCSAGFAYTQLDAPVVTITSGPADGSVAPSRDATFAFEISPAATYCWTLDGDAESCEGPVSAGTKAFAGLDEGAHAFSIRAQNAAGSSPVVTRSWTVDTIGPAVELLAVPPATWPVNYFPFTFRQPEAEAGSSFECSIDGAPYGACASPWQVGGAAYDISHTFAVRAVDAVGNRGAAATAAWTPVRGLVLRYPFDRDLGNDSALAVAFDHSAQVGAPPGFVGGREAGSLVLSSLSAFGTVRPMTSSTAVTIGLWVKLPAATSAPITLLSNRGPGGNGCEVKADGRTMTAACYLGTTNVLGTVPAPSASDRWVHVAISGGVGGPVTLYVDGVAAGSIPDAGFELSSANQGNLTASAGAGSFQMDDLRVYNLLLDDRAVCEVLALGRFDTAGQQCLARSRQPVVEMPFEGLIANTGTLSSPIAVDAAAPPVFGTGQFGRALLFGPRIDVAGVTTDLRGVGQTFRLDFLDLGQGPEATLFDLLCPGKPGCPAPSASGGLAASAGAGVLTVTAEVGGVTRSSSVGYAVGSWHSVVVEHRAADTSAGLQSQRVVVYLDGALAGVIELEGLQGYALTGAPPALAVGTTGSGLVMDEFKAFPATFDDPADFCRLATGGTYEDTTGICLLPQ